MANLVVWSTLFDRQRRIVLSAGMLACRGRVQRESDVIHVVAEELEDLSALLRSVGNRQHPFPVQRGPGADITDQNGLGPREWPGSAGSHQLAAGVMMTEQGLRVPTRSFR